MDSEQTFTNPDCQALQARVEELERQLAESSAGIAISESLGGEERDRSELLMTFSRDIFLFVRLADGRILDANAAAVSAYGYHRGELLALSIHALRPLDQRAEIDRQLSRAGEDGILFETVHRRKDGSDFPVEVSSKSATLGGERILISVIRDITERKQAEAERERLLAQIQQENAESQRQAEELNAIIDTISDPVLVYGMDGIILRANQDAVRVYGFDPAGSHRGEANRALLVYDPDGNLVSSENLPSARALKGETVIGERLRVIPPSGREYMLLVSSTPLLVHGVQIGAVSAWHDITELEQAEAALRKSEQFAQKVLASSLNGLYLYDFDHDKIVFINPAYTRLTGYTIDDLQAMSPEEFLSLFPPEDLPRILEHIRSVHQAADGEIRQIEYRFRRADGVYIWGLSAESIFSRNPDGSVKQYIGAFLDITERKAADEALRNSEARYRELAEAMPQLVWTALENGQVDYHNRRAMEYHGIEQEEDGVWRWSPAVHPDDLQKTVDAWQRALDTGENYECKHRVQMADGTFRWHLSRGLPVKDDRQQVFRWYGTTTDIHDLKLAEDRLRDRSERLALLSDAAEQLLRGVDVAELIARLYQRMAAILGLDLYAHYTLSKDGKYLELAGDEGFPPDARPAIERLRIGRTVCGMAALNKTAVVVDDVQHTTSPQARLIRSIGVTVYSCHPLLAGDRLFGTLSFGSRRSRHFPEDAIRLMHAVADLVAEAHQRRQAEITLQEYAARLERSNRDLQEFAFVASHDLHEPLRKIEAFGSALFEISGDLTPKQADYINRMRVAAGRMRTMVDDLLALSRVNRFVQPFALTSLNEVARNVLVDLDEQIERTGGKVDVDDLPSIEADPSQMRQLLQNLIGNALKFHQKDRPPRVRITCLNQTEGEVEIAVQDDGIGFPQSEAGRIFQPFQRLVSRKDFDGSGIGLAICRKIVERHIGSISAYSQPGQGAKFVISLPTRQPALESAGEPDGEKGILG